MTLRKLIGLFVALAGIALGAFLTGTAAVLLAGGKNAAEAESVGRMNLLAIAALGAVLGYGVYRLGRKIAR